MTQLLDYLDDYVFLTAQKKKLTIDGITELHDVYRVKLDLLYYNDKNDRIATWINKHEVENGPIDRENLEEYNTILEGYIHESDPEAMKQTKNNIYKFKQREPGVVLPDGRIIDGNRRFTCLRELYREGKTDFGYFETVILRGITNPTDRRIKVLELNIQLATEKQVDYNPIDRMYAAYRDIRELKLFTEKEYANETNMKPREVSMMLKKAELMNEFLEFLDSPDQYYIAREMKLDGPLTEAVGVIDKCRTEDEQERMKVVIFTHIIMKPTNGQDDITRHIRKLKKIAGTEESEDFLDSQEQIAIEVQKKIKQMQTEDKRPVVDVIRDVRSDAELKKKMSDNTERTIRKIRTDFAQDLPITQTEEALNSLQLIKEVMITNLSDDNKVKLDMLLDDIEKQLVRIRGRI